MKDRRKRILKEKNIMDDEWRIHNPFKKRALVNISAFFALGLLMTWKIEESAAWAIAALCAVSGLLIAIKFKKLRYIAIALISLSTGVVYMILRISMTVPYGEMLSGNLTARVSALPDPNGSRILLILDDAMMDEKPINGKVRFYVNESDNESDEIRFRYGDHIQANDVTIKAPSPRRNEGGSDTRLNAWMKGANYDGSASNGVEVVSSENGILTKVFDLREKLISALKLMLEPEIFANVQGMLFGDDSEMDDAWVDAYRATGAAHILAVSGLHVGIIASAISAALRWIKNRRISLFITLSVVFLYTAMNGFSTSITRAFIMITIVLCGRHIGERSDLLNSLGLAALLSLLINPFQLFGASFLMSFSAVLGIAVFNQPLHRALAKIPIRNTVWVKLRESIAVMLSAQLGLFPVQSVIFGTISLVGLFLNLIVVPLASFAVVFAFITAIVAAIFPTLGIIPAYICSAIIKIMSYIVFAASKLPGAAKTIGAFSLGSGLALIFLYLAISRFTKGKKMRISLLLSSVLIFAGTLFYQQNTEDNRLEMVFLDVGQGDSIFIKQGKTCAIIDGGNRQDYAEINYSQDYGEKVIMPFLRSRGIDYLDALIISHADSDHYGGFYTLLENIDVGQVITGDDSGAKDELYWEMLKLAEYRAIPHLYISKGDKVDLGKAELEVLWPEKWQGDSNETSLVLRVEYEGKAALFTGDIGAGTEEEILKSTSKVDLLKVAHHGSKHSSSQSFLEAASPDISIIQVGNNNYGHPSGDALERINSTGSKIFTTLNNGAIQVLFTKDNIEINGKLGLDEASMPSE